MISTLRTRHLFFALNRQLLGLTLGQGQVHNFATSSITSGNRAIVYTSNGDPSSVLYAQTFPNLPPPPPNTVNVKFLLSPINPADINVIEGVYPTKPVPSHSLSTSGKGSKDSSLFVGGNEGLAEVVDVGPGITGLQQRDWVVMTKPQSGTWISSKNVSAQDILKVPRSGLSEAQAATMTVNPPTAYNMLHDYVELGEGDWVVQNGANSAVGQAVIQIAAAKGLQTINFVRQRDQIDHLKEHLLGLGATHVVTYEELCGKSFRDKVKEWTGGKNIRLGLNCVSGKTTTFMARLLGQDAHLVSYGAMSKEPLSLPTSLFIFKNLTCHGFWQSRWYLRRTPKERERLFKTLASLMCNGKLKGPEHEVLVVSGTDEDNQASLKIRDTMARLARGKFGKKLLLKIEETL
ncbi:NAD(P)-binding protein [Leucogyrophana mollusca]|uniref:NAD(P)-binding protein n=1 Tax=Leucogyrophana mollusca TaxID=85980 RepID=A0ACB8BPP6_9AGAM|nr:NAD(P)-binding protein [Leucogyrophana mollusca]